MLNELEKRYYADMQPFFEAMAKEMAQHDEEKGESYKLGAFTVDRNTRYSSEPPIFETIYMRDHLFDLLKEHWKKLRKTKFSNLGEYLDHADFCYMIWWQLTYKPNTREGGYFGGIHEDPRIWESFSEAIKRTDEK